MSLKKLFTLALILFFAASFTLAQDQAVSKTSEKQCCEKSDAKKAGDCTSKNISATDKTKDCCNKDKTDKSNKSKTKTMKSSDCCMEKKDGKKADCDQQKDTDSKR